MGRLVADRRRGSGKRFAASAGPRVSGARRPRLLAGFAVAAAFLPGGCGGPQVDPADDPARERFVAAFVALRRAAARSPDRVVPAQDRDRILAEHGMSGDEMLAFVDEHGEDLDYMEGVWSEVDARIRETEPGAPTR